MAEETNNISSVPLSIEDQIRNSYVTNRAARDRFEDTPEAPQQQQLEALRIETAPIIEQETTSIANDQKGIFSEVTEFGGNVIKGALQGAIAEPVQALGGPDKLFGFKEPKDFGDQVARGFGQALSFFIPAAGGIRAGLKLANLFQKSQKLSKAGAFITNTTAGALTDAFAFDPRDPNAADLALALGVISKDSRAGAATKAFLAQKDTDPEATARFKAALTGLIAGGLIDLLIKASGATRRAFKKSKADPNDPNVPNDPSDPNAPKVDLGGDETGNSLPKGTQEAADDLSKGFVEGLEKLRNEGDPNKINNIREALPDEGPARKQIAEEFNNDPRRIFEDEQGNFKEPPPEMVELWNKLAREETIPDQDLNELISMNFLKSGASADINNTLQFMSRYLDVKTLVKPSIATADFDTVIPEMLTTLVHGTDEQIRGISDIIKKKTTDINEAIPYIGTIKLLNTLQLKKLTNANTKFAQDPSPANQQLRLKEYQIQSALLFEGAGLSKATSDALRAHGKMGPAINNPAIVKDAVQKRFIEPVVEIQRTAAGHTSKLDRLDKLATDEVKAQTTGAKESVEVTDASSLLEVTGKAGPGRKRKITINTFKETPTGKRIASAIKKLESTLLSLKRPERGAPFPKKKSLKDIASPEQLATINGIKSKIKQVKADRDSLFNKFKKNAKPQLKLRKKFEKLSKQIEKLQEGIDPRVGKSQRDKITSPDIATLQAERDKLLSKLKPLDETERILQNLNDEFSDLLIKRLDNDFGTITKVEKEVIGKDIREAIKREKERAKDAIRNAEIEEAFSLRASAAELRDIDKMTFSQQRTRLAAMDRGFTAKSYKALAEVYVNGLLSSGKTIAIVNPMGTMSSIISSIFERSLAALKTTVTGKGDVDFEEVITLGWNYMAGLPDFFRVMGKALRHGPSDPNFKVDYMNVRDRGISKEAFNVGGNLGKAVDYIGTAVNIPGKLLISTDEAFKALIGRAEQRALSYRKARNEVGLTGTVDNKAAIRKRTQEILDDVLNHEDILEQARSAAAKNTFTNVLPNRVVKDAFGNEREVPGVALSIKQFIDQRDPTGISRIFIPFFQTPANIFNFTFERTPLINRFSNSLKQELKSTVPGVKELAEARMASAWVIWGSLMTLAYQGNFTGAPPRDPRLRLTMERSMGGRGWWSGDFGNGLKTYDKFDPFGLILSASAIAANMAKGMTNLAGQYVRGDDSDAIEEKYNEVLMSGVVGLSELLKNKTFLSAIGELVDVFSTDGRSTSNTLRKLVSFDPRISLYSSLRRDVTRYNDPNRPEKFQERETEGDTLLERSVSGITNEIATVFQEGLDSTMFGWGNRFAMKDLAGNIVQYPGTNQELDVTLGAVDKMLNTINKPLVRSTSPLINKLAELEAKIGQPSALHKVNGVMLNDEEKAFTIDIWTKRNKILDKLVVAKGFNKIPPDLQLKILTNLINQNKRNAIEVTKGKFSRLQQAAKTAKIDTFKRLVSRNPVQGYQPPNTQGTN